MKWTDRGVQVARRRLQCERAADRLPARAPLKKLLYTRWREGQGARFRGRAAHAVMRLHASTCYASAQDKEA
jgi:hypothetical protein